MHSNQIKIKYRCINTGRGEKHSIKLIVENDIHGKFTGTDTHYVGQVEIRISKH